MEKHIFRNINKFNPELILISAGFDAHKDDPLGQLNLDEKDFIWVTNEIKLIAEKLCSNRLVSILEGGYNISALSSCVLEHIKVFSVYFFILSQSSFFINILFKMLNPWVLNILLDVLFLIIYHITYITWYSCLHNVEYKCSIIFMRFLTYMVC